MTNQQLARLAMMHELHNSPEPGRNWVMGPTLTYVAMGVVDYPVVLAYDGENPIGAALVKEDRLLMFYVKPSHRRQGIGAQLYRDLEAKVGPNGTDMWWAMPPDDGAAAFYNKMGASM